MTRHLEVMRDGNQYKAYMVFDSPRQFVPVESPKLDTFAQAIEFAAVVAHNYEITLLAYGFAITGPHSEDIARAIKCAEMYGNDSNDYDWPLGDEYKTWPMSHFTGYVR